MSINNKKKIIEKGSWAISYFHLLCSLSSSLHSLFRLCSHTD